MHHHISLLGSITLALLASGCCAKSYDVATSPRSFDGETPVEADKTRTVEESDLYAVAGDWLYVQNEHAGLLLIDTAPAFAPQVVHRLPEVAGPAGELYVRDERVFVLFKGRVDGCSLAQAEQALWPEVGVRSEVVFVHQAPTSPEVAGRFCLPGDLLTSRVVGDVLYAVTSADLGGGQQRTWLLSLDLADLEQPHLVDHRDMQGEGREVHVTDRAIYLAQDLGNYTQLTYVDISDPAGSMTERDQVIVAGSPQGRFHMDEYEDMFRIVTDGGLEHGTHLHVIDVSDPDDLRLIGSLHGLAPGEELWAAHFVGDKAYVVTYLAAAPEPMDPLWVISLEDPTQPTILGELIIPGWSTFIYPRGDLLFAVGRGDRGMHVAASLFDVSDPANPTELRRLEFGDPLAESEANLDFRGVSIIEDTAFGEVPLITVPFSVDSWRWDEERGDVCTRNHQLQLIDLLADDLTLVAQWAGDNSGSIRRVVPVDNQLYVLGDNSLAVVDIADRSVPATRATVPMAEGLPLEECSSWPEWQDGMWMDDWEGGGGYCGLPLGCSAGGQAGSGSALTLLAAFAILLGLRRRSHTTPAKRSAS